MYLLVYDYEDSVVQAVKQHAERLDEELVAVTPERVLNEFSIDDEIINGVPYLRWTTEEGLVIKNDDSVKLINCLNYIDGRLFDDFHEEDREYAMSEFFSYMIFALNSFPQKTAAPGFYGLAGGSIPLPQQWKTVAEMNLKNIRIPQYYYGPPAFCPFSVDSEKLISTDLYDYHNWKPNRPDISDRAKQQFLIKRPEGEALLLVIAGNVILENETIANPHISEGVKQETKAAAISISKQFAYVVSEILFFVREAEVTFAMISQKPSGSDNYKNFGPVVIEGIMKSFSTGESI